MCVVYKSILGPLEVKASEENPWLYIKGGFEFQMYCVNQGIPLIVYQLRGSNSK